MRWTAFARGRDNEAQLPTQDHHRHFRRCLQLGFYDTNGPYESANVLYRHLFNVVNTGG